MDKIRLALNSEDQFLLTNFDTLVFYDESNGELRHGEVFKSPRNVTIYKDQNKLHLKIHREREPLLMVSDSLEASIEVRHAGHFQYISLWMSNNIGMANRDGSIYFSGSSMQAWEIFTIVSAKRINGRRYWVPERSLGGTEIMLDRLKQMLGPKIEKVEIAINTPPQITDAKPVIIWIHNEPGTTYSWCFQADIVSSIAYFVFVSVWQMQKFIDAYNLPPSKCMVIKNAIETNQQLRPWPDHSKWRWRCAYISAPYRGLDILLDAWRESDPLNAELHIWSGTSLWARDDSPFWESFSKAAETPNIFYHRIAPNEEIRAALRDMHFLLYPCSFDETFCLSMVEAMSSGCRVIAPARAALPEIAAGFARIYPNLEDRESHKNLFKQVMAEEFENPWAGRVDFAETQQKYCQNAYDVSGRTAEWEYLIERLCSNRSEYK